MSLAKKNMKVEPKCRFCELKLKYTMVDLGMSPLCESFLLYEHLNQMEPFYPLRVYVCDNCFLVQLEEYVNPEVIFSEYAYFSSFADTWLQHVKDYVQMIVKRFRIGVHSQVVEIASNDGYLLQHFVRKGIPAYGIEPAVNIAKVAQEKGIKTIVKFFGEDLADDLVAKGNKADLLIGNNVIAQVPNLNGFVKSMKILLKSQGIITMEFPHLMKLIDGNQFDTIYHEHFSYFSFITIEKIFSAHDLTIFDVEDLPTHGGSLRIYACHAEDTSKGINDRIAELKKREVGVGITSLEYYFSFAEKVKSTKRNLMDFLIKVKEEGKSIVGYGAPGKGNTLLNYCGIRTDFLDYTVDRNPYKHGLFTPGTHIPIFHPDKIRETKPDYLLILPWNFKDEIMNQMSFIREWGGQFAVPIPEVTIY
jgi:C-methyltransferase-like protein/putative zinc binding protein/methyltransferase family protein